MKNLLKSRKMFKVRKLKIDYDDLFFLWTESKVENDEKIITIHVQRMKLVRNLRSNALKFN